MAARKPIYDWLKAQAATITSGDPLFGSWIVNGQLGLAINYDAAEMSGANADKHFGVTLGDGLAEELLNQARTALRDKNARLEFIVYAHVLEANKLDRDGHDQQVSLIKLWLTRIFDLDPSAGNALCPQAYFERWRVPTRGDALEAQPYVLSIGTLNYEEPN
jgi:hypothetical protein